MKCPCCGTDIPNPGKFCGSCGTRLAPDMCPNGHVLKEGEKDCPQCATQKVQKVKTIAPSDKGKTLFEINTIAPVVLGKQEEIKEFPFDQQADRQEVRKTKVVRTESSVSGPMLSGWLVSFERKSEGEDFRIFNCDNIIGAAPVCNVRIDHDSVSSKHAVISYRDGNFYIRDLGSTNGTYLNGIRLDREMLINDGDTITFGLFNSIFCRFKRK